VVINTATTDKLSIERVQPCTR